MGAGGWGGFHHALFLLLTAFFFVLQTIVDAALSGFGPLYGRMMPYLHEVELEEHYFIQGPRVARSEAVVHFAKLGKDSCAHSSRPLLIFNNICDVLQFSQTRGPLLESPYN